MTEGASHAGTLLRELLRGVVLLSIALYRAGRCVAAGVGVAHWLGTGAAVALVGIAALARLTPLLQLAAGIALVRLWHWPALAAAIVVAPRLLTVLPGIIRTLGARLRHPRPRWSVSVHAAGAIAPAATPTAMPIAGPGRDG